MGFLRVNGFSFFHCVASPFHSFVTIISVSICMAGMLASSTSSVWVAGRCTSSMIVSVSAACAGMSDRTSPV